MATIEEAFMSMASGELLDTVNHIMKLRRHIELSIERRAKLMKQLEGAATAAHEYLYCKLHEINPDENRQLLCLGLETSIDQIEADLSMKIEELQHNLINYKQLAKN